MAGICTSSYPIEKVRDSPYPYSYQYQVNVEIPVKTGTGSDNTHGGGFICHLYLSPLLQTHLLFTSLGRIKKILEKEVE